MQALHGMLPLRACIEFTNVVFPIVWETSNYDFKLTMISE